MLLPTDYAQRYILGVRCDKCADNYFGSPDKPGGSCQSCNCSGNVDPSQPGACDTLTGKCLLCLYDTTGFACEQCRPGFFGDALQHDCTGKEVLGWKEISLLGVWSIEMIFCFIFPDCMCDPLGHDKEKGECNPITGDCPCKLNVEGRQCDRCKPGTKLIATGDGCQPCDCDLIGSSNAICNEVCTYTFISDQLVEVDMLIYTSS